MWNHEAKKRIMRDDTTDESPLPLNIWREKQAMDVEYMSSFTGVSSTNREPNEVVNYQGFESSNEMVRKTTPLEEAPVNTDTAGTNIEASEGNEPSYNHIIQIADGLGVDEVSCRKNNIADPNCGVVSESSSERTNISQEMRKDPTQDETKSKVIYENKCRYKRWE